jgi:enoyl-CoA hydratase
MARVISAKGPIAVRLAKRAVQNGLNLDLFSACALETDLFAEAFASEDRKEGMRAFLDKRPARFTGK